MTKTTDPKVVDFMGEDFTKVTFSPDLAKFKMTHLDKDIVDLMSRRAYDVAASTRGVKVGCPSILLYGFILFKFFFYKIMNFVKGHFKRQTLAC